MKWIEFIKAYAEKHNMKYNEALKSKKAKEAYEKQKPKSKPKPKSK